MKNKLEKLKEAAWKEIGNAKNLERLEEIDIKYFGRKAGELTKVLRGLSDLEPGEKKEIGALANRIKEDLVKEFDTKKKELTQKEFSEKIKKDRLDVTVPGQGRKIGHLHPNTIVENELKEVFSSLGFMILDGPELESDYYNFEALNIPTHHPARDMQDTFYTTRINTDLRQINTDNVDMPSLLLRTHTSPVQVRAMQQYGAPLRVVAPGRVFRNEATDASHEHTFYQLEGLMIDKDISIANLIAVMKELLHRIFKREVKVRLRPGFFPFVEPGFELDIECLICGGKGCSVCKQSGWLELLPCGMVHPNVLKAGGIDSREYSGFAFGLGLTRLVMMKYGIDDIRLLQSGDLRFIDQF